MLKSSQFLLRQLIKTSQASSQSSKLSNVSSSNTTNKKLANQVAIVTGSTEGIGFAVAKRMAEDGANVVISSRKQVNVDRAVADLKALYPTSEIIGTVSHAGKEEDREKLVDFTLKKFGSIDILVSNVAVNPYFGPFLDIEESQWDKIFDINVKAPFLLTKKIVPHMMKNNRRPNGDRGAIVYISSIAGYTGMAAIGAYSVSKTALLGLSKNLSMELAQEGIRVNLVAPGIIKTKFSALIVNTDNEEEDFYKSATHMKRYGEPDEVAGIVSFLCSSDASYITGESVVVSGGYHCSL